MVNGLLGLAVAPMAMAESVVTSLYNAPNNAHLAGEYLARASLTEDRHEATMDVLSAVAHGAEGFAGMGGVLAPASAARTAPGLTPAASIVRFADEVVEIKILEIHPGKFDYIFGRVSSNPHNSARSARSAQLATEMKRLGVPDDDVGRQILTEHLTQAINARGNVVKTYSNQYGNFEARESLFIGPSGKAVKFESHFIILEDGVRSLTTVIPFNWLRSKI